MNGISIKHETKMLIYHLQKLDEYCKENDIIDRHRKSVINDLRNFRTHVKLLRVRVEK